MRRSWVLVLLAAACAGGPHGESFDAPPGGDIDAAVDAALPDAALPDASPDADLADAAVPGCHPPVDAEPDAGPPADAQPTPDAAPDAAPGTIHFTRPNFDWGTVGMGSNLSIAQSNFVVNGTSSTAAISVSVTGPFKVIFDSCGSVPAGATCQLIVQLTATTLGSVSGTLTATTGGMTIHAPITAELQGFVGADSTGGGDYPNPLDATFSYSPACRPCDVGGRCCYPGGTQVEVTANLPIDHHLVSWDDPTCGTNNPCVVTAELAPHVLNAKVSRDMRPFEVDIESGTGAVFVSQLAPNLASAYGASICTASCTAMVWAGYDVHVSATTPVDFTSFDAPCSPGSRECTLSECATGIGVAFATQPGEVDLVPGGPLVSVAYDAQGDLLVGGSSLTLYSPALAILWTKPIAGPARFDAAGDVFVSAADGIHKLSANGTPVWTHVATPAPIDFAPTPSGGVVVLHAQSFERWDAAGNPIATITLDYPSMTLTSDSSGGIYVCVVPPFSDAEVRLEAFDPTGARVQPDFPMAPLTIPEWGDCPLAAGNAQLAMGLHSNYSRLVGVIRLGLALDELEEIHTSIGDVSYSDEEGVALNASDELAWFAPGSLDTRYDVDGLQLEVRDASNALMSSVLRPNYVPQLASSPGTYVSGLRAIAIAIAPDGHIAVAAHFYELDPFVPPTYDLVEVFAP